MKTLILMLIFSASSRGFAAVKSERVEYKQGETIMEGYLSYDDIVKTPKAGVLIVHDWMGMGDNVKKRSEEMATLGYVAFAADIYGKGNRPKDAKEASAFATKYKSDVKLLRSRAMAAMDTLAKNSRLKGKKLLAMGYCFGGTTVLEMARAGFPLAGVVSFHGGLSAATPAKSGDIKAKVLVLHGAIDPYVPANEVGAFMKEMNEAKVDYQFTAYANAVHAFTIADAGSDVSKGAAYNALADQRSFAAMKAFFEEVIQ